MKFDYIFFDSGGTLYMPGAVPSPSREETAARRVDRVRGLLEGFGMHVERRALEEAIRAGEKASSRRWGPAYTYVRLMEYVVDALGLPVGPEQAACLADVYAGPRFSSWLFPGTVEAFRTLTENGYRHRLGVIANTGWPGFSMDRAFAGVGLLPFLGVRVYSGDVGVEKPDPAIFRVAERRAECEGKGKRILFVGDDVEADIKGAAAVGWSTTWRRREHVEVRADCVFTHMAELVRYCLEE